MSTVNNQKKRTNNRKKNKKPYLGKKPLPKEGQIIASMVKQPKYQSGTLKNSDKDRVKRGFVKKNATEPWSANKNKVYEDSMGLSLATESMMIMSSQKLIIPTPMVSSTLNIAICTLASRLFYLNSFGASQDTDPTVSYPSMYSGMAWLGDAVQALSLGADVNITRIPSIFNVMLELLTAKTVRFTGGGVIQYTPKWDGNFALATTFDTLTNCRYSLVVPSNAATINITPVLIPPDQQGYANFCRVEQLDKFWGTKLVDYPTRGLFSKDPSAYARNYKYFGTGGNVVGGLYSEVEMEVPFFYPQFSRFVEYDRDDKVISRVFTPQSGGISAPVGLSVTQPNFIPQELKNPIPVNYKYLDFYQLATMVAAWFSTINSITPTNIEGNNYTNKPGPLPFTQKDFFWMLRQALLTQFPEQCHAQFVAPVEANPSSTNSVFVPFIVDSVLTPLPSFANMLLPNFLIENLSMLKSRIVKVSSTRNSAKSGKVPKKLVHNWIPVWGVYSADTPPDLAYFDDTGNPVPLFSAGPPAIPDAQLWDGVTAVNVNAKVQPNIIVADLIASWNGIVAPFVQNKSAAISPINTDIPAKVSLLPYTRILEKFPNGLKDVSFKVRNFIDDQVLNITSVTKNKKAIPPATYVELYTSSITSYHALTTEVTGAMAYFITPMIRLNYTSGDLLTLNAYQTYQGELCSASTTTGSGETGVPEIYRLFTTGQLGSTGLFSGSNETNSITEASAVLQRDCAGSDFFSALMGGLTSMIPVVGPILGNLLG